MIKTAIVSVSAAVFLLVFNFVYTLFSYGQSSVLMQLMFLLPLLGITAPSVVCAVLKKKPSRVAFNLWNSGIAILVFGCIVSGVISISGRFTDYDIYYWIFGLAFLAAAVIFEIISKLLKHLSSD